MDAVIDEKVTVKMVALACNCTEGAIYYQLKKRRNNEPISIKRGRPQLLDQEAEDALISKLENLVDQEQAANGAKLKDLVAKGIQETASRRQVFVPDKLPSKSALRNLRKKLDIRMNVGQRTTLARQRAQQDIRNYVSAAVMHKALSPPGRPALILNFDATTYVTNGARDLSVYPHRKGDKRPVAQVDDSSLELFIKFYFCHPTLGDLAPLVLVVIDETMDLDTIDPHQLKGGSWNGAADLRVWVVFSKTREGNRAFFEWYITTVIVPFINRVRESYHEACDYDLLETAYINCDGELQQVKVILKEIIRTLVGDNYIVIGKLPASCSGTTQASDVCYFF